jgi:hypothetical protein
VKLRAAIAVAASLALLGCGGSAAQRQQAAHRPASSPSASSVIDGITCSYPGSTPVHYHAHLNLFSSGLGGHSLMGAMVMARLNERFRLDVPLRELFDAPSVASLAEAVDRALAAGAAAEPEPALTLRRYPRT